LYTSIVTYNESMDRHHFCPIFFFFFWLLLVCKALFWVFLFPVFQHPDEQAHYGTILGRAHPGVASWSIEKPLPPDAELDVDATITQALPEEIVRGADLLMLDTLKYQAENTQVFSSTVRGQNEEALQKNSWSPQVNQVPNRMSPLTSWYYSAGILIEKTLDDTSFLTRFFSLRIFSTFLGLAVLIISFFTFRALGFSSTATLAATSILAFHPMLTAASSQINIDIALILSFFFYTFGVVLLLEKGSSLQSFVILILAILLGIFSKGPGILLVIHFLLLLCFVLFPLAKNHLQYSWKKYVTLLGAVGLVIGVLFFFALPQNLIDLFFRSGTSLFASPTSSLIAYLGESLTWQKLSWSYTSYFGYFGWLDTPLPDILLSFFFFFEILALVGLILFFKNTSKDTQRSFLPKKPTVIFLLFLILLLQVGIRFFDWRFFDTTGLIVTGAPGRYFLPTLLAHILLVLVGLGQLFTTTKNQFSLLTRFVAIFFILLFLWSTFLLVLPRYYF
jgi:hypothetical protein